jgi:hypothetical protein
MLYSGEVTTTQRKTAAMKKIGKYVDNNIKN